MKIMKIFKIFSKKKFLKKIKNNKNKVEQENFILLLKLDPKMSKEWQKVI